MKCPKCKNRSGFNLSWTLSWGAFVDLRDALQSPDDVAADRLTEHVVDGATPVLDPSQLECGKCGHSGTLAEFGGLPKRLKGMLVDEPTPGDAQRAKDLQILLNVATNFVDYYQRGEDGDGLSWETLDSYAESFADVLKKLKARKRDVPKKST